MDRSTRILLAILASMVVLSPSPSSAEPSQEQKRAYRLFKHLDLTIQRCRFAFVSAADERVVRQLQTTMATVLQNNGMSASEIAEANRTMSSTINSIPCAGSNEEGVRSLMNSIRSEYRAFY